MKKEIEEVVQKYENERLDILNVLKEKGGGVPTIRSKKSTFNRQSLRRAHYGKK